VSALLLLAQGDGGTIPMLSDENAVKLFVGLVALVIVVLAVRWALKR